MEYSFDNNGRHHSIKLDTYSLIYKVNDEVFDVRYAQISKIRLKRPKKINNKRIFEATIYIIDGPDIHLQSFSKNGSDTSDHFNQYTQFIRVLHMHLISKSNSSFRYGMSYKTIFAYALTIVVVMALVFFNLPKTGIIATLYFMAPVAAGFFIYKILADKPGSYRPDVIPYDILPGN